MFNFLDLTFFVGYRVRILTFFLSIFSFFSILSLPLPLVEEANFPIAPFPPFPNDYADGVPGGEGAV